MSERNLKMAVLALAAAIGLGIILMFFAIMSRGAGSLHPQENGVVKKWGDFLTEQPFEEQVTTTHEGFTIQNSGN